MTRIFSILALIVFLAGPGCSRQSDKAVVAKVNGRPILLSELRKELRSREGLPADAEEQLQTMIDRRLLVDEAARLQLYEGEQFKETMRRFYEQTLIRELIGAKSKEWADRLTASDGEIEQEYRRMQQRVLVSTARAKDRGTAQKFLQKMRKGEHVDCEENVSCSLGDVRQSPLENAFDMKAGEVGVFGDEGEFVVISVKEKEKIQLPPLKQIREQVRGAIIERKRQKAMADWLESLRTSSSVKIDRELLKSAVAPY